MKTYIYTIIGLLLVLTSCDGFLDPNIKGEIVGQPQTDIKNESIFKTKADALTGLAGAYVSFRTNTFQFELFGYNDIQSDNCYHGGDGIPGEEEDAVMLSSLNSKTKLMWGEYFQMIGAATSVIGNTAIMNQSLIDDVTRNAIMAEGKFIRAYAYLDVVRIWGDAPLMIELMPALSAENLEELYPLIYPTRVSKDELYAQIIKDLTEALPYLSSDNKGSSKATKGAAYLLLAKLYATQHAKSARNYGEVVKYCDMVLAEGYSLVDEFDDLWDPEKKFTSESIFEINYATEAPNWAYWVLFSEEDGSVTWRRYCTPTHELIAKYKSVDKRFASSIVYKSVPYDTHYPKGKYPISNKIRSKTSNITLMRLADVLLLKAEALVEQNKVSSAMIIVNQIRTRAGLPALPSATSQDDARLAVELERQLELYMEGHRWFDLLRNDRTVAVMTNHKYKDGIKLVPTLPEFRLLWPIPQNEKDTNPNLSQNTGY